MMKFEIQNSIQANKLNLWINRFNCKLINILDKITSILYSEISQSVLDLTFAT